MNGFCADFFIFLETLHYINLWPNYYIGNVPKKFTFIFSWRVYTKISIPHSVLSRDFRPELLPFRRPVSGESLELRKVFENCFVSLILCIWHKCRWFKINLFENKKKLLEECIYLMKSWTLFKATGKIWNGKPMRFLKATPK